MYFAALATDYDGTLAKDGHVDAETIAALRRVQRSGRKLMLVTGRELPELQSVFPELEMFDLLVVENGALLYDPKAKEETRLAPSPPEAFVKRLIELQVTPLSVGESIVASREPNEKIILEAIKDLGLELSVIFNKGAVMVLPANINKATGMVAALDRLKLSFHNVVGIGDAENDHAFLITCGCAVAVQNAIEALKRKVDLIVSSHGKGVVELAERLIAFDLRDVSFSRSRSMPEIGAAEAGHALHLDPFGSTLVTGVSANGRSNLVRALIEQACTLGFQTLVLDPGADYAELEGIANVGSSKREPEIREIMSLLEQPDESVVAKLSALDAKGRSRFFAKLLPELSKLRQTTGRPHWVILGAAHHFLPADLKLALPRELPALVAVTAHPEHLASGFLQQASTVIGVGKGAKALLADRANIMTGIDGADNSDPSDDDHALIVRTGSGIVEQIVIAQSKDKKTKPARTFTEMRAGGAAR